MSEKLDVSTLARKMQRTDDVRRLSEACAQIPLSHEDRVGLLRAIEILRMLPLRDES